MRHNQPDEAHIRPEGVSDQTVEAAGKVSEALEWVERARGHLYELHQLLGRADFIFEDAADCLRKAGHASQADLLEQEIIGRNVLPGRWTFQIVEEFDEIYYQPIRKAEETIRNELMDGKRHVFESELKEKRRSKHRPGHESRP